MGGFVVPEACDNYKTEPNCLFARRYYTFFATWLTRMRSHTAAKNLLFDNYCPIFVKNDYQREWCSEQEWCSTCALRIVLKFLLHEWAASSNWHSAAIRSCAKVCSSHDAVQDLQKFKNEELGTIFAPVVNHNLRIGSNVWEWPL